MKQWQKLTDMFKSADVKEEMSKKYRNTILGITLEDDKTVFMTFTGYNDNFFCFSSKEGQQIKLSEETLFEVFIPNPEKGLYNSQYGVIFFKRKPIRQWKRGLNKDNAEIVNLERALRTEDQLGIEGTNQFDSYWDSVTNQQQNEPVSLDVALTIITESTTTHSWAINRTYGVMAHPQKPEGFILLHHMFHVGEIVGNEILVANKIFKQEILDTQAEWCPNYKVI